jgi:hypothetical protein
LQKVAKSVPASAGASSYQEYQVNEEAHNASKYMIQLDSRLQLTIAMWLTCIDLQGLEGYSFLVLPNLGSKKR